MIYMQSATTMEDWEEVIIPPMQETETNGTNLMTAQFVLVVKVMLEVLELIFSFISVEIDVIMI